MKIVTQLVTVLDTLLPSMLQSRQAILQLKKELSALSITLKAVKVQMTSGIFAQTAELP
jgi:hypothetical protein